jgi:UDP-galactopyranose mutase
MVMTTASRPLPVTSIVREYPQEYGPGREPYYPIPTPDSQALYERYKILTYPRTDSRHRVENRLV